ncbi:MAG: GatB/YqeY domain-containing protein [Bacteroidales bacterium]|nr:GatB/YqeY domain-containing protein [Bacteroidales bacterium]
MNLFDTISKDIKNAMLKKEKEKLEVLRAIKTALLLAKTEKGQDSVLSEETEIKLLQKLIKQRKEAGEIYKTQVRKELANKEFFEAEIIQTYLPEQISEEELIKILKDIITETGASSVKDMGKVIGLASKRLAGKADGKMISEKVKMLLS